MRARDQHIDRKIGATIRIQRFLRECGAALGFAAFAI
jgi:hypothetical protein